MKHRKALTQHEQDAYPEPFRKAFFCITKMTQSYNLYLSSQVKEDLASKVIEIYYEKLQSDPDNYVDFKPINRISELVALEFIRTNPRHEYIDFDELAPSGTIAHDESKYTAAISFIMDHATATERIVLEAFLKCGQHDIHQIAECINQPANNVSKYLNKLSNKIRSSCLQMAKVAADQLRAAPDEPASAEHQLLMLTKSKGHALEYRTAILRFLCPDIGIPNLRLALNYATKIEPRNICLGDPKIVLSYATAKTSAALRLCAIDPVAEEQLALWGNFWLHRTEGFEYPLSALQIYRYLMRLPQPEYD